MGEDIMDAETRSTLLQSEWTNFNSNIGALYTFFENLSETADKLDQERKKNLAFELANILGETPAQIEKEIFEYMPSIDDMDVLPDLRENVSAMEMIKELQDQNFKDKLREWENRHPHKSYKLAKLIFSVFGNPPISGFILRKSLIITLITFLEVLIESMYVNHYLITGCRKDDAIKKAEKLITKRWDKRLNNLVEIGIPANISLMCRDEILEIIRLRNLFVHNDGIIDQDFLKWSSQGVRANLNAGNVLVVSTKRLERAINLIFVYGLLLCQSHWKRHENNDSMQNAKLEQLILTSFDEKRYSFIIELSEKFMILDFPTNINQRLLVDRAIAFRDLEKFDDLRKVVSELETSNHDWQIDIAVSALKQDYAKLRTQLAQANLNHDIRKFAYWPLFDPIRNEIWFKMAFRNSRKKVNLPKKGRTRA